MPLSAAPEFSERRRPTSLLLNDNGAMKSWVSSPGGSRALLSPYQTLLSPASLEKRKATEEASMPEEDLQTPKAIAVDHSVSDMFTEKNGILLGFEHKTSSFWDIQAPQKEPTDDCMEMPPVNGPRPMLKCSRGANRKTKSAATPTSPFQFPENSGWVTTPKSFVGFDVGPALRSPLTTAFGPEEGWEDESWNDGSRYDWKPFMENNFNHLPDLKDGDGDDDW